jgi:vitamin B12 transporter
MRSHLLHARRAVLSLAALAACSSFAQTTATLEPVVVTATRVETPLIDVLADVSIIDRHQIEAAGLQSLTDVLANLPGVQISTSGSYRSITGVLLRGATSSQTILLLNGIRLGSATTGSYSLENIPLDRIDRIEVLRGAAAALYGPDAVGGVIQVFTREADQDGVQRSVSVGLGTDGQRKLGGQLLGQTGAWRYGLGVSNERAKGINVRLPGESGFNIDDDGFKYLSADANLAYRIHPDHELSVRWFRSEGEYDFDGSPFPNPLRLSASTARAVAEPKIEQQVLRWQAQWSDRWSSVVSLGDSRDIVVSRYWRESDGAAAGDSRFNTHSRQLSWQNDIRLGNDTLTLLAEQRTDNVDSSTAYTVTQRRIRAAAASYALKRSSWDALLTVRHDRNSQFGSFNNWALSGGYKLNDGWRLVGSLGTTFQAPSFNQLYWPGFGNPDLAPQKGKAQELGLRYQQGRTKASAVVYRNDVKGFIDPATNVQSSLAVLKGLTLAWEHSWGATALSMSYDHTDPRLKPSNDRVTRVARDVLRAQVSHRVGAWKPYAELRLSSDREDTRFPSRVTLAGYGVMNLGASYQINPKLSFSVRVNNLTDKAYVLADGFSTPGRNAFVSLQWQD